MKAFLLPLLFYSVSWSACGAYREIRVENTPFPMSTLREFVYPARDFSIADYGAKPDGRKCTDAFAAAMEACEKSGGGRVVVPDGTWVTGPIHLGNNCNLYLSDGAVVSFSDDPADYFPAVDTSWEGVLCRNYSPLVYACGKRNVAVTGRGTLVPRMERWNAWAGRNHPGRKAAMEYLYYWCATNAPLAARDLTRMDGATVRPQLLQFNGCENVLLEDFKIHHSPFWMIHLLRCEDCIVRRVRQLALGGNTDALDIEMTRNVLVEDCDFYAGDDGIAFKSGRNQDGWRIGRPTENVVVRRCRLRHAHGLVACGSELSGGIRNILVEDCRGDSVSTVLAIKTNRRRGGFVENVTVRNIDVEFAEATFRVCQNTLYSWARFPDFELRPTSVKGILFENVRVQNAMTGVSIESNAAVPVRDVTLRNVWIGRVTGKTLDAADLNGLTLDHVEIGNGALQKDGYCFDALDHAERYAAISPNFAKAIAFLTRPDLQGIGLGRHEIDGSQVYAMVEDAALDYPREDGRVELHRDYADIQMALKNPDSEETNVEFIGIGPLPDGVAFPEFGSGRDVVTAKALLPVAPIYADRFAIIMPGTPHAPGIARGAPHLQRKLCIKIRKDW